MKKYLPSNIELTIIALLILMDAFLVYKQGSLFWKNFLPVFDNTLLGTLVAGILLALFGKHWYEVQKQSDRNFEVRTSLTKSVADLQGKFHDALFIIDRIANTYKTIRKESEETKRITRLEKFLEGVFKTEVPSLSSIINEEVQPLLFRISSTIHIYFDDQILVSTLQSFTTEAKMLHEVLVQIRFDLKERVNDQEILSPDKFDAAVKDLIQSLWRAKFIKR